MKNGLEFVNVLYLLAKHAWWQLFLGAEEKTCLEEWLNRWDDTAGTLKAQQQKETPTPGVPNSPRVKAGTS